MKLELLIGDSKKEKQIAMAEAHRQVQHDSIAFIGPGSSGATTEVSKWLSIPSVNRGLIGYSATSSELSDSSAFPNYVRTPPTDDVQAVMMAQLMKGRFILDYSILRSMHIFEFRINQTN